MSVRRKPRTFWQWLTGRPVILVTTAHQWDDTPVYSGPEEKDCMWCGFCPHTEHAHHIALQKKKWMDKSFSSDKLERELARNALKGLADAEREMRRLRH